LRVAGSRRHQQVLDSGFRVLLFNFSRVVISPPCLSIAWQVEFGV
jgi:hypothetical protein